MKRTGFASKLPAAYVKAERIPQNYARLTVPVKYPVFEPVSAIPKEDAVRSEEYRRVVADMPCIRCGYPAPSQAAHADMGKGGHIKTDDRTCFPACATRPGVIGCHELIGSTGTYTRDERRALEADYAVRTRKAILDTGKWPTNLPKP